MRLKATKTRLYSLVLAHYPDLPPMRQTEFVKAPRDRAWWLRFSTDGGRDEAFFAAVCGKVLLTLDGRDGRKVVKIPLEELEKYDLVEGEAES